MSITAHISITLEKYKSNKQRTLFYHIHNPNSPDDAMLQALQLCLAIDEKSSEYVKKVNFDGVTFN